MAVKARRAVPVVFRSYLLSGEHWRFGRRVRGEVALFTGLALHRTGAGDDGQVGPMQFSAAFLEHLEQAIISERVEKAWRSACQRWRRVEAARREVWNDRPDESMVLDYYITPRERRPRDLKTEGELRGMSADALRYNRDRAIVLVWEELGGVW